MSNILVTGGAGFIGSHVTEALINRGHDVTVLDDLSGGFRDNVHPQAEMVVGSITDVDLVNRCSRAASSITCITSPRMLRKD